jgi:hypothetical protein
LKWRVSLADMAPGGEHWSALGRLEASPSGRAIHSPRTVGKNGKKWEFLGGLRSRSRDPGPPGAQASQAQCLLVGSS